MLQKILDALLAVFTALTVAGTSIVSTPEPVDFTQAPTIVHTVVLSTPVFEPTVTETYPQPGTDQPTSTQMPAYPGPTDSYPAPTDGYPGPGDKHFEPTQDIGYPGPATATIYWAPKPTFTPSP